MPDTVDVSDAEWQVWREFFRMRRQLDLVLERQLQHDADISAADYEVLITVFDSPDRQLRARELGLALGWEKSRLSHQVTRMERRGLVLRTDCDTDARGTWIGLTPDGRRAVLGAMRDHARALRQYFFDLLDDADRASLLSISGRVLEAIEPTACEVSGLDDEALG